MILSISDYVPILRKRQAELVALTNLLNEDFGRITPLIEMCEHILPVTALNKVKTSDPNLYLYNVLRELGEACGNRPYFIDFGYVEEVFSGCREHPVDIFFNLASFHVYHDLKPIPVTGLRRSPAHQEAIKRAVRSTKAGICVRVSQKEIRNATFVLELQLLLRNLEILPEDVHLLVDLQEVNETSSSIREICERIPMLEQWRSFVVSGGAFPRFLSKLAKNEEHVLPRLDWNHWLNGFRGRHNLLRMPSFSDYTVQYPKKPTPLDFLPKVSASIRYTDLDQWIIMRGEWLGKGAKYQQYWGLANALMFRNEFSGHDFSFADQTIARIGTQTKETGNTGSWLTVALNRHLTLVARQLSQLFAQPSQLATGSFGRMPRPPLPRMWNKKRIVLPDLHNQGYLFPAE